MDPGSSSRLGSGPHLNEVKPVQLLGRIPIFSSSGGSIASSTLQHHRADYDGALYAYYGGVYLNDSTIYSNTANVNGHATNMECNWELGNEHEDGHMINI